MSKPGTITFKQKDKTGHFYYSYKISNYHAAMILQYIAQNEHEPAPFRDGKGKFISCTDLLTGRSEANNKPSRAQQRD